MKFKFQYLRKLYWNLAPFVYLFSVCCEAQQQAGGTEIVRFMKMEVFTVS